MYGFFSFGFNVLYLFGVDRVLIKGWKWLWLCLRGFGSERGGICLFFGVMVIGVIWNFLVFFISFVLLGFNVGVSRIDFGVRWFGFKFTFGI